MGPSGCGKSTLLDALAGRLGSNTRQKGDILINGKRQTLAFGTSVYLTQDDALTASLTVREAVYYSAELQLPNSMSKSEKKARAEATIKEMGLEDCMDTRIGGWHVKGLSGGQKRRVSICIEILRRPKLLFLDEPTSGLDSAASYHVVKRIIKLAQIERISVVASIHQPSSEVFELFHNLCLLSSGQAIYFGPTLEANEFFGSNGFICPPMRNPADHYLRTINQDFDDLEVEEGNGSKRSAGEVINILNKAYDSSDIFQQVKQRVDYICQQNINGPVEKRGSQAGFISQCIVLTRRSSVNMFRDLGYYWFRFAVHVGLCICVGTVFRDIGFTYGSNQARASALVFISTFMSFMAVGGFPSFAEDMKVPTKRMRPGKKQRLARYSDLQEINLKMKKGKSHKDNKHYTSSSESEVEYGKNTKVLKVLASMKKGKQRGKSKTGTDKEELIILLNRILSETSGEDSGSDSSPINQFGHINVQARTTYYRCNVRAAAKDLKSLQFREGHIMAIKRTPFWVLFNSLYTTCSKGLLKNCQKYEDDVRSLLKTYHTKSGSFLIGGDLRKPTKNDVQMVFGVTGGSQKIPISCNEYTLPAWVKRCFERKERAKGTAGTYQLYKAYILNQLKEEMLRESEEAYKDVARLVHCYLLAAFLSPTKNGSLNWHLTCCCEVFEEICSYDWCDFVLQVLMDQIKRSHSLRAGGCVMLLLYWLCEFTNLIQPVSEGSIPRYLKWDLSVLNKKLKDKDLCQLKAKYIRCGLIRKTNEEKAVFKELDNVLICEYERYQQQVGAESPTVPYITLTEQSVRIADSRGKAVHIEKTDDEVEETCNLGDGNTVRRRGTPVSSRSNRLKQRAEKRTREKCSLDTKKSGKANTCSIEVAERERTNVGASWREPCIEMNTQMDGGVDVVMNTPDIEANGFDQRIVLYHDDGGDRSLRVEGNTRCTSINEENVVRKNLFGEFESGDNICPVEPAYKETAIIGSKEVQVYSGIEHRRLPSFSLGMGFSPSGKIDEIVADVKEVELGEDNKGVDGRQCKCHDIDNIRAKLECHEEELRELKERLRSSNSKNEALQKSMNKSIQRKVENAVENEKAMLDVYYLAIIVRKDEEIESLRMQNEQLTARLNAEINPTESQFVAKESNLQLIDAMEKLYTAEKKCEKLKALNDDLAETVELFEIVDRGPEAAAAVATTVVGGTSSEEHHSTMTVESEGKTQKYEVGEGLRKMMMASGEMEAFTSSPNGVKSKGKCVVEEDITPCESELENKVSGNITPCGTRSRTKRKCSPNSMIQRVKCRTDMDDRSKLVVTPQPTTRELMVIEETNVDQAAGEKRPANKFGKLPLNRKCRAVKEAKEGTIIDMEECWEVNQHRAVIWAASSDLYLDVLLGDIISILNGGCLSNSVVDAWGRILLCKYATSIGATRTVIFSSCCWDLIHHYGVSRDSALLEKQVDKRLENEVGKNFVLMFPMLTSGSQRYCSGDHWTLLKLDLCSCTWTFYNSIEARTKKAEDVHLKRSIELVAYVEKKLTEVFRLKYTTHAFLKKERPVTPIQAESCQQVSGTLDCGVVVCDNMEQIVRRTEVKKGKYRVGMAAAYRVKMVEWLMDFEEM